MQIETPRVSVVTRTCGRMLGLERALHHLRAALSANDEWVIVDDRPRSELSVAHDCPLAAFIKRAEHQCAFPVTLHVSNGAGRSAAANVGLAAARGKYFHLHDDDDTVEADFYARTCAFLEAHPSYKAVATRAYRVTEKHLDGELKETRRIIHNPDLAELSFASLAAAFQSPPICVLLDRAMMEKVGEFDTDLNTGEDWDYLLRFLCVADIGIITEPLCSVHHRIDQDGAGLYANSSALRQDAQTRAILQNHHFRSDLRSNTQGLGWALFFGELHTTNRRLGVLLDALFRNNPIGRWLAQRGRG